jgi:RimJ/RimL family protein N-acetyltransferase
MNITKATILETKRLYCQPFSENDFQMLYALHSTPEVGQITIDGIQNQEQALKELKHFIQHQSQYTYSQWMFFEKASHTFIGRGGFEYRQVNPAYPPQMEIRYALFPQFWGQGYATELAQGCLAWAYENIKPEKIVATANPVNYSSHRVLEKVGFVRGNDFEWRERVLAFFIHLPPRTA